MVRGSLADWEREFRARLAVAEEERELAQMRGEMAHLHGEVGRLQAETARLQDEVTRLQNEVQQLRSTLRTAEKMLMGLRDSRGYRLLRLLGRWDSLEQTFTRTFR